MDSKLETLKKISHFLRTKEGTAKIKKWVKKHKPTLQGTVLYLGNRPIIPEESVRKTLMKVGKRGMPLNSQKAAWEWIKERFAGITYRDVTTFLTALRSFEKKRLKQPENINRYKINDEMIQDIKDGLKGEIVDSRTAKFLRDFPNITNSRGKLMMNGKQILSVEQLPKIINDELVSGACPMSCEACYNYLRKKYIGSLTRKKVTDFIKSLESWQLNKIRPPNPEQIKGNYTHKFEGTTRFLLSSTSGGNWNTLCADLMYIPKQWSKYKFFLAVVHMRSGYCWFEPLEERKAKNLIAPFKKILKDAEKRFGGKVKVLQTDAGVEFLAEFAEYLKESKIKHVNDWKSYHTERKIGQFGRSFGQLLGIGIPFAEALVLTTEKLNNTKSRVTGKQPNEVGTHDRLKKPRKLKKGARKQRALEEFEEGDKVRFQKKNADPLNGFYKSYGATSRKPKHENWSRTTPKIAEKKYVRGLPLYKLEGETKWRKGWHLQKVNEVRKLVRPKEKLKKQPDVQKKIAEIKAKKPKVRREKDMKNLEPDRGFATQGSYWAPVQGSRRSRRRRKPNYVEIDLTSD